MLNLKKEKEHLHKLLKVSYNSFLIFSFIGGDAKEAPARKFDESDVKEVIAHSMSFDDDQLGYVNFLDSLIRIAHAFPFNEEELADMVTFEMKVLYFVQKLEVKYSKLKDIFSNKMNDRSIGMGYTPRVVVDEGDESDYDMDN